MKHIIHINQHNIKHNRKNPSQRKSVITVKNYKETIYTDDVTILGKSRVVYQPDNPLSCGAHVWIETDEPVEIINPRWIKYKHKGVK